MLTVVPPAAVEMAVTSAVAAARAAQPAWAATPIGVRVAMLARFHELVYRRRADIAALVARETGKPPLEALSTEIGVVLDDALFLQRAIPQHLKSPWFNSASRALMRKRLRVVHEPYGVVGVIAPWNYPFMLACARILPALATGNAVVFKPSELTPETGALTRALLVEAGVPEDVIGLVQGDGAAGAALAASPVDKVFLTGSTGAGRSVARACADRLVPCSLELGGSDPAIVLADADIPTAASGLVWGRFTNAGQTCLAPKRIFVETAVYDAFVTAVARATATLRVGSAAGESMDIGAMIAPRFRTAIENQLSDAIARGARIVASAPTVPGSSGDALFAPTVLADVPAGARVMTEETFGPLMVIERVSDEDEAVARANAGEYGMAASVWTRDSARAGRIAGRLICGAVSINEVLVTAGIAELPHGGVRMSGYGRVHGSAGIADCVRTKGIVAERFPGWRQGWWFGYSARSQAQIDAFIRFAHDPSPLGRLRALPGVLRLLISPDRPV